VPLVVFVTIAMISLSTAVIAFALFARPDRRREVAVANLRRGLMLTDTAATATPALNARRSGLGRLAGRLTPRAATPRLEKLLARAGHPPDWPLERLLVAKLMLAIGFGALGLLCAAASGRLAVFVLAVLVMIVSYFVPELLLYSRGLERNQAIELELADTLDQMTIAVEAGLGFDAAMARAGRNGRGPLAEELVRTLQDIQMGRSRRQAYEALAARTDTVDLRRFIRAVIQADAYGISIADVLRTQAAELRMKRRQRAEQKAMQVPVKVIFPLMLCILPVLFIVLLGPVAMQMITAFS
jgi:tight adherence protein C